MTGKTLKKKKWQKTQYLNDGKNVTIIKIMAKNATMIKDNSKKCNDDCTWLSAAKTGL